MFIDLWCWLSHFIPTSCEHPSEWSDGTRCARWGWTSGIFAQIQPLVLWPSRMLRASKIRCNSQLATWRCWKPVPDGGFQTSQKTSYFQTFFHWCVQEWGGFMPSVWPFFRWNGWNECFPEFSVPNPYANHQLGVHPFTARWCVVCWFVGPRDTMQGTQSYQPVGSRGRSNQRNTSSHHIPSLLESSTDTDTPKWPKEFGHLGGEKGSPYWNIRQVVNIMLMLGLISSIAFAIYTVGLGGDGSRCGMRFFFHNSGSEKKIYLWKDSWETNISKKLRDPTSKWRAAVRHWSSGLFSATAELPQGQCEPFLGARRGLVDPELGWTLDSILDYYETKLMFIAL